ncbi:MAG: DUF2851 family protein [candidate division KSB1 bacterium]|nr:DUF2851 family protein [candidate division KSB1 bacterium]MDZ7318611.1 DUF2851 family protein [candidate division KSB1 bacterium]MDZ7339905.1 DUF2851 family protein [candidate division KSB1 bacterium]
MKVDDRSVIAEQLIFQLWERGYFSTIPLTTIDGRTVTIISTGIKNEDAGPDFKNITIRLDDTLYQGDLEIHRAPEDWYQHSHHADAAYNQVIMHLVIGPMDASEPAIRLNRHPVAAQVFVDIPEEKFYALYQKYQLDVPSTLPAQVCQIRHQRTASKLKLIEYWGLQRLQDKADRFTELRETCSWNQILYVGMMEALGYSKNQAPFRQLAHLFPFEAVAREFQQTPADGMLGRPLGILLGLAGLLPSQDPTFDWRKIKDSETQEYIPQLEEAWREFSNRLGLEPMRREQWQFFRMRPSNFPTRRLAGACLILQPFLATGMLEPLYRLVANSEQNPLQIINALEKHFICRTTGYWASHYQLEDNISPLEDSRSATLIGQERAREIVINVVLPVILAHAREIGVSNVAEKIWDLYHHYPRQSNNSIVVQMIETLFTTEEKARKPIQTSALQQGLLHLYKLYCRRGECDHCLEKSQPFCR